MKDSYSVMLLTDRFILQVRTVTSEGFRVKTEVTATPLYIDVIFRALNILVTVVGVNMRGRVRVSLAKVTW